MDIINALSLEGKDPRVTSLKLKVIVAAKMLLHLLDADFECNVSELARQLGVSRQSLYNWGWLAISVLGLACLQKPPGPKPQAEEAVAVMELKAQMRQLQWEKDRLYFANHRLEVQVATLRTELVELVDRAVVVLRLSGKVSYRGIQECVGHLFGVHMALAEIEAQVEAAGNQAQRVLKPLLATLQVKWAAIDEVYLKEAGQRIYGLVVVDVKSRVAITLHRATDRQTNTWQALLDPLPQLRDSLVGLVADLARPYPGLVRALSRGWHRPVALQACNVHAMRALFKLWSQVLSPYRQAKARYQNAYQAWTKQPDDLTCQAHYLAARQVYRFERRLLKYIYHLLGQVFQALRQPSPLTAQTRLAQTLAQLTHLPAEYQPFVHQVTQFFKRYQARLLVHLDHPEAVWTTNVAESAFSQLRRFVTVFKAFSTPQGVEAFFALFLLYYNLKPQRFDDGQKLAPLARAGLSLQGNYLTYLGFQTPAKLIPYSSLKKQVQPVSTQFSPFARAA